MHTAKLNFSPTKIKILVSSNFQINYLIYCNYCNYFFVTEMVQLLERELNNSAYVNESEGFLIKKKNYERQYAPLYAERLISIRSELEKTAAAKWKNQFEVMKSLVDLETNKKSIIIGTLFQEMKNKPNILKVLADDESNMVPIQVRP